MNLVSQKIQNYSSLLKAAIILLVAFFILGYSIYLIVVLYKNLNSGNHVRNITQKEPEGNSQQAGAKAGGETEQGKKESGQRGIEAQSAGTTGAAV
jgi:type III secretory pathway component EscV